MSRTSHTPHLPARAPHALQEAIPLRQPVHAVVALAHRAHEAAERIDLVLARVAAILVNLGDGDLDGCCVCAQLDTAFSCAYSIRDDWRTVVFGLDDAVGGAALAGDVAGARSVSGFVWAKLCGAVRWGLQVDEFSL